LGKPRIILDTNVMVSVMVAELSPMAATPDQIRDLQIYRHVRKHGQLCFSEATMVELRDVAVDVKGQTSRLGPTTAFERIRYVDKLMNGLKPMLPGKCRDRCRDRKDQMLLDLAVGVGALFLISHDDDLTRMKAVGNCQILKPGRFYREVLGLSDPAPAAASSAPTSSKRKAWRPNHQVSPTKGFNGADRAETRLARQTAKHALRQAAETAMVAREASKPGPGRS
jgi:putative PIN family toxin of toxin-antitoxin system